MFEIKSCFVGLLACLGVFAASSVACTTIVQDTNDGGGVPPGDDAGGGTRRDDTGAGSDGGPGGTFSTGNGGTCCLNGAFYGCSSKAAFDKCVGFDMDACMKACGSRDFECSNACFEKFSTASHDPSACTRDAAKDGTCSAPKDPPPPTRCKGSGTSPFGASCSLDSHCCSTNCTGGRCQTNGWAAACTLDSHCDSDNCTDGKCQHNTTGAPCTLDSHCNSNNCTNRKCQF